MPYLMNVGMTITPPIVPMSHPKSIPPKQALRCQQKFFSFLTCSLAETYRSPKSTFKIASCGFHESRFKYLKLSKLFTPAIKAIIHRNVPEQAKANTRHPLSVSATPMFCLHPQTVYLWRVPLKSHQLKKPRHIFRHSLSHRLILHHTLQKPRTESHLCNPIPST